MRYQAIYGVLYIAGLLTIITNFVLLVVMLIIVCFTLPVFS